MKCIILAGGSGERLWPISRSTSPKSLLKLDDDKTLLQNTFELAQLLTTPKNILTVTNIRLTTDTNLQLKPLCKTPIIISEPMSKNTAPAVSAGLAFAKGKRDDILQKPLKFRGCLRDFLGISKKL